MTHKMEFQLKFKTLQKLQRKLEFIRIELNLLHFKDPLLKDKLAAYHKEIRGIYDKSHELDDLKGDTSKQEEELLVTCKALILKIQSFL